MAEQSGQESVERARERQRRASSDARSRQYGWRIVLVAGLLLGGFLLLLLTQQGGDPGTTSTSGEVPFRKGDRVVVVALEGLDADTSTVSAQLAPGAPAGVRVRAFGVTDSGFRVVLGKPAPSGVAATWTATGLTSDAEGADGSGEGSLLQLGLLALAGLVVLFSAFLLTHVSGTG